MLHFHSGSQITELNNNKNYMYAQNASSVVQLTNPVSVGLSKVSMGENIIYLYLQRNLHNHKESNTNPCHFNRVDNLSPI